MPRSRGIDFEIKSGGDLKRISRELRHVGNGREVRKRLTREIRREVVPLVPLVRAEIMKIPTEGKGSTGLRKRLAKATVLQVRTTGKDAGVVIRTDGRKMPPKERTLPGYMEGTRRKPWRHPVYGNREVWAVQQKHPYFYRTVIPYSRRIRKAVQRVANSISRDVN